METLLDEHNRISQHFGHKLSSNSDGSISHSSSHVSSGNNTQTIAVPQPGGTLSIVHVSLSNPSHSVIQHSQQSVIQAPSGGQTINGQGTVIQSTETDHQPTLHSLQLVGSGKLGDHQSLTLQSGSITITEEDAERRRENLARRPSYRKILNELSSTDSHILKTEEDIVQQSNGGGNGEINEDGTITLNSGHYASAGLLKVVQASTLQEASLQGISSLTMANSGNAGTIVQYHSGQDGYFVPVTMATELQAYQMRSPNSSQIQVMNSGSSNNVCVEESSRKRELRLLKNREAAKECRRKKKEYIKCLENRVAVLENQNKALIDELKTLKELYCRKPD